MANTISDSERQMETFQADFRRVHKEISKVIVGYSDLIDDILMTILGKGHVLLEGVPGLGKTKLVQTLSDTLASEIVANPVHSGLDAGRYPRNDGCPGKCRGR